MIQFRNVDYTVIDGINKKKILDDISFVLPKVGFI